MSTAKTGIKDLPETERPREKLVKYGPSRLTNAELLALLLRTGKRGEDVLALAGKVLKGISEKELPYVSVEKLEKFSSIGKAKAAEIVACFELGKRLLKNKTVRAELTAREVFNRLTEFRDKKKEYFFVFYLDSRNREISREVISVGTLNSGLVHPREVFEPAVRNLAANVIIAHNHPSGAPEPSAEDLEITGRLKKAGEILGIELTDHIIITGKRYYSFRKNGLL